MYLSYLESTLNLPCMDPVLAFPCNQFGGQEAGSLAEIKSFCTDKYHVSFPIFSKIEVNGKSVHPLYAFLKKELSLSEGGGGGEGAGKDLGWNFFKVCLFDPHTHGRALTLFPPEGLSPLLPSLDDSDPPISTVSRG